MRSLAPSAEVAALALPTLCFASLVIIFGRGASPASPASPAMPLLAPAESPATPPVAAAPAPPPGTQRYGTRIDWFPEPREAYAYARRTGRLVFEMHISGEFHDPGLT